jgi:hypothetical protein
MVVTMKENETVKDADILGIVVATILYLFSNFLTFFSGNTLVFFITELIVPLLLFYCLFYYYGIRLHNGTGFLNFIKESGLWQLVVYVLVIVLCLMATLVVIMLTTRPLVTYYNALYEVKGIVHRNDAVPVSELQKKCEITILYDEDIKSNLKLAVTIKRILQDKPYGFKYVYTIPYSNRRGFLTRERINIKYGISESDEGIVYNESDEGLSEKELAECISKILNLNLKNYRDFEKVQIETSNEDTSEKSDNSISIGIDLY